MGKIESQEAAAALQRLAAEKFGSTRAEELREDIRLLAAEIESLRAYEIGFEDEP
jgi:hypothetical protein